MPASFEQQREMIATFRSVVHSLLTVPEPLLMKDLDGNLIRHRVTNILNRLVDVGILTGASEQIKVGRPNQLAWRFIDATGKDYLIGLARDDTKISKLLWPDEEPEQEEVEVVVPAMPVSAWTPPEDPVALVAAVLEGFNDRLSAMEQRTTAVDQKMDKVAGGMAELISAVSTLAAKTYPKPYDDTELLLTIHEFKDQVERATQDTTVAQSVAPLMKELAQVTVDVKHMIGQLMREGVTAHNDEMMEGLAVIARAFKSWAPAMEECIAGVRAVNNNIVSVGEEITSMQSAIVQSLNAMSQGKAGVIKTRAEAAPLMALPNGLRRGKSKLPSLSQMLDKKDQKKEDLHESLNSTLGRLAAEATSLEEDIARKNEEIRRLEAEDAKDKATLEELQKGE